MAIQSVAAGHSPSTGMPPASQTIVTAPETIRARPATLLDVNGSFRTVAARIAVINGITPGKREPACAAGAKSSPALVKRTVVAPPRMSAARPGHPRRSNASPVRTRYGASTIPATAKRIAAMSQGVRLDRRPRPATTILPAQMLTAPKPKRAPRVYPAAAVRSLGAAVIIRIVLSSQVV